MRKTSYLFSHRNNIPIAPNVLVLSSALLLLLAGHSFALTDEWEPMGPSGGTFFGAVSNPADADAITAVLTYPSRPHVFRTVNGGMSWSQIGEIPYTSTLYDFSAYDFTRLFAVTYSRCYYSTNGGANWSYGAFPSSSGYARCVCVDPTDSSKVFAAGYKYDSGTTSYSLAFFKSVNGGSTWTASQFFTYDTFYAYDMTVSKSDPDVIYVCGYKNVGGSYYGALLKSTDGGAGWSDISSLVEPDTYLYFYSLEIDPLDENHVYVGGTYFYHSTDGGASWTRYSSYPLNARDIAIDPVNTANLYAGCYGGNVFVSTDHGRHLDPP